MSTPVRISDIELWIIAFAFFALGVVYGAVVASWWPW